MSNCKEDFLKETNGLDILCAVIRKENDYLDNSKRAVANLPVGFTKNELSLFLLAIDYPYDDDYGVQEVFGTIWYKDGTWSERGEYDGSEWWEHRSCPEIPESLNNMPNV
jgi:hypothetical protein